MLDRLEAVKRTGKDRWLAKCPAHPDNRPSLSVRELDDGRLLIHDFGGCETLEVLAAIGLDITDLFADKATAFGKPERRPFNAMEVLACIAHEALIVYLAALDLAKGLTPSLEDRERLGVAAGRLAEAYEVAGGK